MAKITLTPFQDAYIAEYFPDQNFGSSDALFISRFQGAGDIYRSLIQFDLCNLC